MQILDPSPQATLQGAPRTGLRDMGVPWSGPADPLSHAIANHLVGNVLSASAIEITFGPFAARFLKETEIALSGAEAAATINGMPVDFHRSLMVRKGDEIALGRPATGLRTYLAVAGGISAEMYLGSTSTYLPAGFGGHSGRALRRGDELEQGNEQESIRTELRETPNAIRLPITHAFALRATAGPDANDRDTAIWSETYRVTQRASRIGIELAGKFPAFPSRRNLPSAAVFPGALQLPPQGRGFLLLSDCQTTGGYPHMLQVNRTDRHLLGQIRPGDSVRFLQRTSEQAAHDLKEKQELIGRCLPGFQL